MGTNPSAGLLMTALILAVSATGVHSDELSVREPSASFEPATDSGMGPLEPGFVTGFANGCGRGNDPLPGTNEQVLPPGVERVGGPISGQHSNRVWIIDSGIAEDFDTTELNVDRMKSVECTPGGCRSKGQNTARMDKVGHGTMIAGIIGAIDDDDGLVGVAPGVTLIAVQIFKGSRPNIHLKTALEAIKHVADPNKGAQEGDVVNISWGIRWNISIADDLSDMEELLKDMADRGVKIAVAAGNYGQSGYVQAVSPARIGAYRGDPKPGAIMTISAVSSTEIEADVWQDVFWPGSLFGNGEKATGYYKGPPDFAEPGVDIVSLWPGGTINTCTGTSFSAAHAAGILVKQLIEPTEDSGDIVSAEGDPSADHPVQGYDSEREDPIGIHQ